MDAERIRAAAEWATEAAENTAAVMEFASDSSALRTAYAAATDLALIASKLAAGEWVLCSPHKLALTVAGVPVFDGLVVHARIPEEP